MIVFQSSLLNQVQYEATKFLRLVCGCGYQHHGGEDDGYRGIEPGHAFQWIENHVGPIQICPFCRKVISNTAYCEHCGMWLNEAARKEHDTE